ncbi:MAG: hypothetical protein NTV86_00700 [Planctomycetota bacterium]|nr:hypothetical protein [Planctomycetota bacterium]
MSRQKDNPLDELNRRLAVVRDRVRSVAIGGQNGFYLYGRAGTSKTFTVMQTLAELGVPYYRHVGHLTEMGLFDLLAEQYDRVLVLDDVGELFSASSRKALQLLLAALGASPDGSRTRPIHYKRLGQHRTVYFTGGIIFISNLELSNTPVHDALKSRVQYLKYEPTDEQIAALMYHVAAQGWPAGEPVLRPEECLEVAEFIVAESNRLDVRLDMRLLVDKALPDYCLWRDDKTESHWRDLVRATMEERLVELQDTSAEHLSRFAQKQAELQIVREIRDAYETREERAAAWKARTGKSERAFYRRLKEL